jgi:tRNA-2-methylthio-N6-dimethylallyladenosine synthase
MGRNSQNKVVIFDKGSYDLKPGDYVQVKVNHCSQATLFGEIVI